MIRDDRQDRPAPIGLERLPKLADHRVRGANAIEGLAGAGTEIVAQRVGLVEVDEQEIDVGIGGGLEGVGADRRVGRVSVGVELGSARHERGRWPRPVDLVQAEYPLQLVVAHRDGGVESGVAGGMDHGWDQERAPPAQPGTAPGRRAVVRMPVLCWFMPVRREAKAGYVVEGRPLRPP